MSWELLHQGGARPELLLLLKGRTVTPDSVTYDNVREIARCLTEIYSSLKFCQPVIFGDFLSDTDEFLSHFIEFLSNTGGCIDSH